MINLECESLYQFCPEEKVEVGNYKRAFCPQTAPNRIPIPSPEIDTNDAVRSVLAVDMGLNVVDAESVEEIESISEDDLSQQEASWKEEEHSQQTLSHEASKESSVQIPPTPAETWKEAWAEGKFKNVITVIGPGIYSRSMKSSRRGSSYSINCNFGTLLTERCDDLVKRYGLSSKSALFEMDQLVHKPKAFYELVKNIFEADFEPTTYHWFLKLLAKQSRLLRHYSFNIDMMERLVDLPDDLLVEASGTFHTSHCIDCRLEHSLEYLRNQLTTTDDHIPRCVRCRSLVRPDLVFVGEQLPLRFHLLPEKDFAKCDLLLVMGTHLESTPIAELFNRVSDTCLRVVVVDMDVTDAQIASLRSRGWQQGETNMARDAFWQARNPDPGETIWDLARDLEILDDLETLILNNTKSRLSIGRSMHMSTNSIVALELPVLPCGIPSHYQQIPL